MKRRGTTLIELMVVMSVWAFIMTAVLGFYIYATKVHKRYDEMSRELRFTQQIADKFNTVLRNARIKSIIPFPPTAFFTRIDENLPSLPGCLLPNLRPQVEFIGIAPDKKRAANAEAATCLDNTLYLGIADQPGQALIQLPHGLIAEFQLHNGVLILSFNNPTLHTRLSTDKKPDNEITDLNQLSTTDWKPVNYYLQYRGLSEQTEVLSIQAIEESL